MYGGCGKVPVKMTEGRVIVDSDMDFAAAVAGSEAPREVLEALCLIDCRYIGYEGCLHAGQIVAHRELAGEIRDLFALLEAERFPVCRAAPIVRYGWSDEASMAADNTSAFNYRRVAGTDRLSRHALGRAVDINPFRNPAITLDGAITPAGASYQPGRPGTFSDGHPAVQAFQARGWRWGGHFTHLHDFHHFEK